MIWTEENVDKIRRKKIRRTKKANEAKKAQGQIKATLRIALDEKAYERIMNVKIVNENYSLQQHRI